MDDRIRGLVETTWDYHHLDHELAHADAILVLCAYEELVEAGYDKYLL